MRTKGVTLLELMIAIAILAIVSAIAVPGFNNLIQNTGRTVAVNDFIHSVYLARSEAMKRGVMVSLCKSTDGLSCNNTAADWSGGWMVFVNDDRDEPPERDADEPVLSMYEGWSGGSITSNREAYSFRSYTQGVINGTMLFCDPRGSAEARAVIISHTGRPRVSQRDSSNRPLRCPAR